MALLLMILAFDVPEEPECIIDRCEGSECIVETPEGWVSVPRKADDYEGKRVICPFWLIEPT
jgi:hypothetical protein